MEDASQNYSMNLESYADELEDVNDNKKKEMIDDLLKSVPYNLSVALIKISQLNNYDPLPLDTYYNNILPAFELLRRTDGSKYRTNSKTVVRSAMVSNRLYNRTPEGLYEINFTNAIKHLQMIKQKKAVNESDFDKTEMSMPGSSQMSQMYDKPDGLDTSVYGEDVNMISQNEKSMRKMQMHKEKMMERERPDLDFMGKKRRRKKFKRSGMRMDVERYVRTYELLQKLMKITERDKALYSQINFDFSEIGDPNNINEKKINIDKIIGMLTVFKFYRTFLEKFFNAVRIQDTLREKIAELNSEANYIEAIFRSSE
jgi:hypothetical protein